jgi:hypothetical protein
MTDKNYEKSIRKQLSETFNEGFIAFKEFKDNPTVYERCVKQHIDKAKMLMRMNTDMELLCERISLDFKSVIEEEYQQALFKLEHLAGDR